LMAPDQIGCPTANASSHTGASHCVMRVTELATALA
jgi:hypothetical protein